MTFPNIFTLFFINYIKNRTILSSLRQLRLFWYGFCAVCNRTVPILSFCSPFENSGLLFRTGSVLPLYSLCTASVLSSNHLRVIFEPSSSHRSATSGQPLSQPRTLRLFSPFLIISSFCQNGEPVCTIRSSFATTCKNFFIGQVFQFYERKY